MIVEILTKFLRHCRLLAVSRENAPESIFPGAKSISSFRSGSLRRKRCFQLADARICIRTLSGRAKEKGRTLRKKAQSVSENEFREKIPLTKPNFISSPR
jgi:hypothetical protein